MCTFVLTHTLCIIQLLSITNAWLIFQTLPFHPSPNLPLTSCFDVQLQIPNYLHGDPGLDEIPGPCEGEYVDLNTTHSCSNLLPLGTTTQLCDSAYIEVANITLLVKRRGAKSFTSDSGWLDLIGLTSGSTPCPLQSVAGAAIFIWTYSYKFYTLWLSQTLV